MNAAFSDASIDPTHADIDTFTLPDPHDRHVAAAAKASGADTIVTHNTRDFPAAELAAHGLRAVTPDEFLVDLLARDHQSRGHGDTRSLRRHAQPAHRRG
jgi:predicted nucleic acid-binding protein